MTTLDDVVKRLDVIEHLLRVIVKALLDEDDESVTSLDGDVTSKARDQGQSL